MHIQLLLLDGVFDTGLASLLDAMAIANLLGASSGASFHVSRRGVRARVATAHGHRVELDGKVDVEQLPDVVVVPALGCLTPETLQAALSRPDVRDAARFVATCSKAGVQVAAACTGTFVVASSGVLDGRVSTTTWWLEALFRQRYPAVEVDASRMLVEQPGVVTAGAALGHVDLALWLVRQVSPQLAHEVARYLLFDDRMLQSAFAMVDHLAHDDPMVARFEAWTRAHLADFSIGEAARAVGTTQRTLQRRIRKVLGRTPIDYVRDIRVQRAVHRLRTSDATIDAIADEVGYADGVTLRTVLRKKTGKGLRELRRGGT